MTAPAVDGKATEAARRLGDALEVRAALVELRSGAASRDKLFTVMADPAEVESRVRRLRDGRRRDAGVRAPAVAPDAVGLIRLPRSCSALPVRVPGPPCAAAAVVVEPPALRRDRSA